ncbi:MAG: DUF433 domain-containing protein [Anaerolineae bacterium]|nr:DUF433 domain-containing protein [Anaerolineae bacterium]
MVAVINPHVEIIDNVACVVGTRFKVADVAAIFVFGSDPPIDWVEENYPLTRAQVHAALAYYYDHQDEIKAYWAESEKLLREMGTSHEEVLAKMRARLDAKQTPPDPN